VANFSARLVVASLRAISEAKRINRLRLRPSPSLQQSAERTGSFPVCSGQVMRAPRPSLGGPESADGNGHIARRGRTNDLASIEIMREQVSRSARMESRKTCRGDALWHFSGPWVFSRSARL